MKKGELQNRADEEEKEEEKEAERGMTQLHHGPIKCIKQGLLQKPKLSGQICIKTLPNAPKLDPIKVIWTNLDNKCGSGEAKHGTETLRRTT